MKFKGFLKVHSQEISNIQKIIDPIIISLLFNIIVVIPASENTIVLNFSFLILILSLLILPKTSLYISCRNKSLIKVFGDLLNSWAWLLASVFLVYFFLKLGPYFSRIDTLIWSVSILFYLILHHILIRHFLRIYRTRGGNTKNIIFCGPCEQLETFNENLEDNPWLGLKIVSWFNTSPEYEYLDQKYSSIYKGSMNQFEKYICKNKADEIIFAVDNNTNFEEVLNLLGDTTIPISYFPSWANLSMKFHLEQIGNKYIISLWGHNINKISLIFKRTADILVSLILLIFIAPLLILISLIIKLDSKGPIIFLQLRSGLDGKNFHIYKFRTMIHNKLLVDKSIKQATKFDKRITKVGKILRRWSLDELPQLLNVIKGDMSIVGPRPHAIEHNNYYRKRIRGYMQRHFFKPGITGLAQINGYRGETKNIELMEQRIQNDLIYINNWSFLLDISIITKTTFKFKSKNAY